MQFLFVGPNVCRQLLSDSQSPTTPLLLANTPYCKAYSGLSPYSLYPCLTHQYKRRLKRRLLRKSKNRAFPFPLNFHQTHTMQEMQKV